MLHPYLLFKNSSWEYKKCWTSFATTTLPHPSKHNYWFCSGISGDVGRLILSGLVMKQDWKTFYPLCINTLLWASGSQLSFQCLESNVFPLKNCPLPHGCGGMKPDCLGIVMKTALDEGSNSCFWDYSRFWRSQQHHISLGKGIPCSCMIWITQTAHHQGSHSMQEAGCKETKCCVA